MTSNTFFVGLANEGGLPALILPNEIPNNRKLNLNSKDKNQRQQNQ
jgi:hypothetical protein